MLCAGARKRLRGSMFDDTPELGGLVLFAHGQRSPTRALQMTSTAGGELVHVGVLPYVHVDTCALARPNVWWAPLAARVPQEL